ncbi:class I SAM-dependent methyltransferase [Rhizobium binxianense]
MGKHAGASFEEADVVENYPYRPPYPDRLFQKLLELVPGRSSLLDIGCGPGKISRPLSKYFRHVVAVDPSRHMLALGKSLPGGDAPNIRWIEGFAENFPIGEEHFDLIVAAASIHWMDHERLFPHLRPHVDPKHIFAIVSGDTPFEPAWQTDWHAFLGKWIPILTGVPFDPDWTAEEPAKYRHDLDIRDSEYFLSAPFHQSVADFIRCQHSRDTFAPSKLGSRAAAFDAELAEMLALYARSGMLTYRVRTKLVWGSIRAV